MKGTKNPDDTVFPVYLDAAPEPITADFARVYVQLRGVDRSDEPPRRRPFVQLQADRSDSFRRALAATLRAVVDEPDAIRATSWPVRVYEPAASELRQWLDWLQERVEFAAE